MPGFPDKFAPFYKSAPGSLVSSTASYAYGNVVRFLRRMSQYHQNREALWDKIDEIPSGWALQRDKQSSFGRVEDFLYRAIQYARGVKPGRDTPQSRSRDGWEPAPKRRQEAHGDNWKGEMQWGYARRREKVRHDEAEQKREA